jgi:L-ascorbate metabolism protein UlaG (beta-lactamase superfamily)
MMKTILFFLTMILVAATGNAQPANTPKTFEKDTFKTSAGNMVITFIGHGSLMIEAGKRVIHIDPTTAQADYSTLPKADMILVTHEHGDHLDKKALDVITQPLTKTIISFSCKGKVDKAAVLLNGEELSFGDLKIEAVPAYNILNKRADGIAYHPKGNGNGYVINFGGKRIYVAGDTENIPEMASLKNIDIAILPMNLPYTMTPQMVADGARSFMPAILYPYHYGETDPQLLVDLLKNTPIKVRIRKMK